jgi:hypothetical protein
MARLNPLDAALPVWQDNNGQVLACIEKIRVLNENLHELRDLAQATLEDGLLIGCDEQQLRSAMHAAIDALQHDFRT